MLSLLTVLQSDGFVDAWYIGKTRDDAFDS